MNEAPATQNKKWTIELEFERSTQYDTVRASFKERCPGCLKPVRGRPARSVWEAAQNALDEIRLHARHCEEIKRAKEPS